MTDHCLSRNVLNCYVATLESPKQPILDDKGVMEQKNKTGTKSEITSKTKQNNGKMSKGGPKYPCSFVLGFLFSHAMK